MQTVAVPGSDTAQQDALNCASAKVCEGFRCQAKFLQPPEGEEVVLHLLHYTVYVGGPFQFDTLKLPYHVQRHLHILF